LPGDWRHAAACKDTSASTNGDIVELDNGRNQRDARSDVKDTVKASTVNDRVRAEVAHDPKRDIDVEIA
jgi:hypothetical protein